MSLSKSFSRMNGITGLLRKTWECDAVRLRREREPLITPSDARTSVILLRGASARIVDLQTQKIRVLFCFFFI